MTRESRTRGLGYGKACSNCRFYFQRSDTAGDCRRYPVKGNWIPHEEEGLGYQMVSNFPEALVDDWCGEWNSRVPPGEQNVLDTPEQT